MLELIIDLCRQNKNVSLYTNPENTTQFIYGRILAVNSDELAIYMISPDGAYDGILMRQTDTIIRLELDGQYEDKMKILCTSYELPIFHHNIEPTKVKESLLSIALETKRIVSLELINSGINDIVGFIESITNNQCRIKQIDEYGNEDGYSYVRVNDISQISYDSHDEERIFKLWKLHK